MVRIVNYTVWCTIPLILSHCPIKSFLINSASLSYWSISYRRVEAQVANVAGDNLFFLERLRDTKCVVDHCLLDGVHLRVRKKRVQSKQHAIWFSQIKDICAAEAFPKEIMWQKKCHLKDRGFQTVSPSAQEGAKAGWNGHVGRDIRQKCCVMWRGQVQASVQKTMLSFECCISPFSNMVSSWSCCRGLKKALSVNINLKIIYYSHQTLTPCKI